LLGLQKQITGVGVDINYQALDKKGTLTLDISVSLSIQLTSKNYPF
jgi:hypothetical protein